MQVGIGPGSVCTTRRQTGVGYPQLSAIIECADAAHGMDACTLSHPLRYTHVHIMHMAAGLGGHIIGDGGCTCPGDVAKAFGGGADFVMLGGMLAGHDESGGSLVERGGKVCAHSSCCHPAPLCVNMCICRNSKCFMACPVRQR